MCVPISRGAAASKPAGLHAENGERLMTRQHCFATSPIELPRKDLHTAAGAWREGKLQELPILE
jgi:hypothetical protein